MAITVPPGISPPMQRKDDLKILDQKLKGARSRQERFGNPPEIRAQAANGMAIGFRIAVEILAAVGVGFGIGHFLDGELGTGPWMMVIFFFLGIGGAFVNVMRVARQLEKQKVFGKGRDSAPKDDRK